MYIIKTSLSGHTYQSTNSLTWAVFLFHEDHYFLLSFHIRLIYISPLIDSIRTQKSVRSHSDWGGILIIMRTIIVLIVFLFRSFYISALILVARVYQNVPISHITLRLGRFFNYHRYQFFSLFPLEINIHITPDIAWMSLSDLTNQYNHRLGQYFNHHEDHYFPLFFTRQINQSDHTQTGAVF